MSPTQPAQIASLYRYPVKGLTPEPLPRVALGVGQTLPADRRYAIENGPSGFDPAGADMDAEVPFPDADAQRAAGGLADPFRRCDPSPDHSPGRQVIARGRPGNGGGPRRDRAVFRDEFRQRTQGAAEGAFEAAATAFPMSPERSSRSSISAASRRSRPWSAQPVHPLRFRANLYVSGWPAWHEFELLDRTLAIGDVRLKVVKRIIRCAAVNVDPDTAARDLDIPHALMRRFGHGDCGVYAEVIAGGTIAVGDAIAVEEPRLLYAWHALPRARLREERLR